MIHFEYTYTTHQATEYKSANESEFHASSLKPWWLNYIQNATRHNYPTPHVQLAMVSDLICQNITPMTLDMSEESRKVPIPSPTPLNFFWSWIYALEFESQEAALEFKLRWS